MFAIIISIAGDLQPTILKSLHTGFRELTGRRSLGHCFQQHVGVRRRVDVKARNESTCRCSQRDDDRHHRVIAVCAYL